MVKGFGLGLGIENDFRSSDRVKEVNLCFGSSERSQSPYCDGKQEIYLEWPSGPADL